MSQRGCSVNGAVKALKAGFFHADVFTVTDSNENGSEVSFLFSLMGKTLGTKMHVQTGECRKGEGEEGKGGECII